ncbi:hypothetical protein [Kangiella marina]|uniref:Uncharacterized protein n=1 Tax=Kangiella marina TaxID=1079178 RepID=A0ABP8II15_9GAMM
MKKTLFTLTALLTFAFAGSAVANEAKVMKQQDLQACERQPKQLPEEVQSKQQERCQCVVEQTDYQALVDAKKSGDMAKIQQIKSKANQSCRAMQ